MDSFKRITKDEIATTIWSGGKTSQIAIFPPTAQYAARDFIWRISSATVEEKTSTFTSLPGIARILITLTGAIQLQHDQCEAIHLPPYTPHYFYGDQHTISEGVVTDFNVMLKGCYASVDIYSLIASEERYIHTEERSYTLNYFPPLHHSMGNEMRQLLVYVSEGDKVRFTNPNTGESITLHKGEALLSSPSVAFLPRLHCFNQGATDGKSIAVNLLWEDHHQ